MAFWTLPALRHFVHTYARCALPFRRTRTRWRFGSKRRFVATIEWLRLCPKDGFFPQTAHILAIGLIVARAPRTCGARNVPLARSAQLAQWARCLRPQLRED